MDLGAGSERGRETAAAPSGRRLLLCAAALFCRAAVTAGPGPAVPPRTPAGERPPDVVLITICSLRTDRVGAYGYARPTSPAIDALAADGVLFEQAVTQAVWTRPAVMSLLTSTLPSRHRITDRGLERTLSPSIRTLAEYLRDRGYRTAAFVSSPDLPGAPGYERGFDLYHSLRFNPDDLAYATTSQHYMDNLKVFLKNTTTASEDFYRGAADWVRARDDAPIFLWVMDYGLHSAVVNTIYPASADCVAALHGGTDAPPRFNFPPPDGIGAEREVHAYVNEMFDASLLCADRRLGVFLDALRERGTYEGALVVVTGDHGEGLWTHQWRSHSGPPFDELARVPLVIKRPGGASAGRRVKEQVRLVDVLPTVLGEAGAPLPEGLDGLPLQGFWDGRPDARDACIESDLPQPGFRAVRSHDGWKLIVNRMTGFQALFRWDSDPAESRNLWGKHRRREGELFEKLLACTGGTP
jgi:arylsulfatase